MKKRSFELFIISAAMFFLDGLTALQVVEADEKHISVTAKNVRLEDGSTTQKGAKNIDGKWMLYDKGGVDAAPTFNVTATKKKLFVDWYTYNGYRTFHNTCHVCHGLDGIGSTYAPSLVMTLKEMSYEKFVAVVQGGQQNVWGQNNSIMPEFGSNLSVICYLDDIYSYLKARATGALPAVRISGQERAEKPKGAGENEKECFGE